MTTPNLLLLREMSAGLSAAGPEILQYELRASLCANRLEELLWRFRKSHPVVEIDFDDGRFRFHLGGDMSPIRASEPALRVEDFQSAVAAVPSEAEAFHIFVSFSFQLEEYEYTLNQPAKTINVVGNSRKEAITLVVRTTEKKDLPPPN